MPPRNSQISDLEWANKETIPSKEDCDEETNEESYYVYAANEKGCCRSAFCGKPRPGCLFRNFVLMAVLIGGAVGILFAYTGNADPRVFFTREDPPGYTEAYRWAGDRSGGYLPLLISNSCEDRWTPAFENYVQQWNSSEVLVLTTNRLPYDFDCTEYRGRMNVCNGDYGNTDWRGVNIAMLFNGQIISSVAKLNDFHLNQESNAQKLYTMCHEIGHGFGLPHTDEEYFNRDRGDCMDYTSRPRNNLSPGQFNFDLLVKLYGLLVTTTPTPNTRPDAESPTPENEDKEDEDRSRRLQDTIPADSYSKYLHAREAIEKHKGKGALSDTYIIQSGQHGEFFQVDLGNGYSMVVDKLLDTRGWHFLQ